MNQTDAQEAEMGGILALLFAVGGWRKLEGPYRLASQILGFSITTYVIYAATIAVFDPFVMVSVFLGLVLGLLFLVVGHRSRVTSNTPPWFDLLFAVVSLACAAYFFTQGNVLIRRISLLDPLSPLDFVVGTAITALTLEATRRTVGLGLTLLVAAMVLYNLGGHLLGGALGHGYIGYEHFLDQTVFTTNGVFGAPLRVAATYAFLFVLFGTLFEKAGGGDFFFHLAAAISGRQIGGPAKVALFSSAIYGTISGSPTSDVVTTGSITIPMMRRLGYPRTLAGAVEVASSPAGGIIPPVMGSAAFIMVEITGIPYLEIAKAAIIPALLYLIGVYVQIHFVAKRLNLKTMEAAQIRPLGQVLRDGGLFIFPLAALTAALLNGYSVSYVAVFGIISVLVVASLRKSTRMGPRALFDVIVTAAIRMLPVTAACAAAGLVVGGISMTGLSGKLALGIFTVAGDGSFVALFVAALIAIVLGMGMPTPSAYTMSAVLTAPILLSMGMPLMSVHFFLLFFAVLSAITPPVAVAAYAAAPLAEGNPIAIAAKACMLAAPAFVIPFIFAFRPELLGQGDWFEIAKALATAILGVSLLAIAVAGYFHAKLDPIRRLLLLTAAVMLMTPGMTTDLAGIALAALLYGSVLVEMRNAKRVGSDRP